MFRTPRAWLRDLGRPAKARRRQGGAARASKGSGPQLVGGARPGRRSPRLGKHAQRWINPYQHPARARDGGRGRSERRARRPDFSSIPSRNRERRAIRTGAGGWGLGARRMPRPPSTRVHKSLMPARRRRPVLTQQAAYAWHKKTMTFPSFFQGFKNVLCGAL